jgi:tetratricopeptide (TPR) repeat protein
MTHSVLLLGVALLPTPDLSSVGDRDLDAACVTRIKQVKEFATLIETYPLVILRHPSRVAFNFTEETALSVLETSYRHLEFSSSAKILSWSLGRGLGQENSIADLGVVDITKAVDVDALTFDGKEVWHERDVKLIVGHCYLLRILDDYGNRYFVLLQILDVEKKEVSVAFVWRRLPGGTVKKRTPENDRAWMERQFQAGQREVAVKNYRKAAEIFSQLADRLEWWIPEEDRGKGDQNVSMACHELARTYREMREWKKAVQAYERAISFSGDRVRKKQLKTECIEMVKGFVADAQEAAETTVAKDDALKKLTQKYPLVMMHSRSLSPGDYVQAAYSFIYESSDEDKHGNNVQLLYYDAPHGVLKPEFHIRMLNGQQNQIIDLGRADFEKDPDPKKITLGEGANWKTETIDAVAGHVYLERVRDRFGNDFYVVFQVVDIDPQGLWVAIVWRKLPGGKVVKLRG